MDKLLKSMSFSGEPQVTLVRESYSGLEKVAAAEEILEFIDSMERNPEKFYLHINAMGAGEYYGSNRNGDYFPEDNLKRWYKTFETTPAHVYRHHVNKNPEIAIGKVIYSYYNDRMHRVELIAELDKTLAAAEHRAVQNGEFPLTSMACNTPYDMCSICGNVAHTRAEYCSHLSTQLNKVQPDGKKVMSMNVGPLKFFDISMVIRPADVTSSVLQKVASEDDVTVGSIDAAVFENVSMTQEKVASIKQASVEKVADIIKDIPVDIVGSSDTLDGILDRVQDPDDRMLDVLNQFPLQDIISTFAALRINPSIEFLVKILASKYIDADTTQVVNAVMSELKRSGLDSIPSDAADLIPEVDSTEPNPYLAKALFDIVEQASYDIEHVEKRASHDGYANWQEGRGSLDSSEFFPETIVENRNPLLRLAGAAIIAKIMISKIVSMPKASANRAPGVEKSAELTVKLMDLSVINELKRV